jgi:hypothetical protein
MQTRIGTICLVVLSLAVTLAYSRAQQNKPVTPPIVAGAWTGTWGIYAPPPLPGEEQPAAKNPYTAQQRAMDCKVESLPDGKFQATFEGECGRPYKYTIKMLGRQAGSSVLFQGSADLGEKDGGVFDWIGRATDKEFVGFFTSRGYTGTFRLARPK